MVRHFHRATLAAVLVVAFGSMPLLRAGAAEGFRAVTRDDVERIGCGKGQAMAQHLRADATPTFDPLYLEAMSETDVLHYELAVEITDIDPFARSATLTGTNRMTIRSTSASLTTFSFRLREQFAVTSALLNDLTPATVSSFPSGTRIVTLDRPYAPGEELTVTIGYTGTTVSEGFGSIDVLTHAGVPIVSTLSEPFYAFGWWPVKDGPVGEPGDNADKATVALSIVAPDNLFVVSNGLLDGVDDLGGGRHRHRWSTAYPIAPYLVSISATNYTHWSRSYTHPGGAMPVDFYMYPENDTPSNRTAWATAVDVLTTLTPLFGEYPFVLEKYGIYNFPFGGGMEHQTISGQGTFSENVTVHEAAHQWWGDMITCRTWSDIWLNEGFATYSEALWLEHRTGTPDLDALRTAMIARTPGSPVGTVYVPPAQTWSLGRIFDTNLTYRKGAWVLHQLRRVASDAVFFQILAAYRSAFAYGSATTDDFADVASATAGKDLTWFFDQWVYGSGAPAYTIGWDSVTVAGREYLHVRLGQTQSIGIRAVFEGPVELAAHHESQSTLLSEWNDLRTQWFTFAVHREITSVDLDPNGWILKLNVTPTSLVMGDGDGDGFVTASDAAAFEACWTGSGGVAPTGCEPFSFDNDADVDCADFEGFTAVWTGPGEPDAPAACALPPIPTSSHVTTAISMLLLLCAGTIVYKKRHDGRCTS